MLSHLFSDLKATVQLLIVQEIHIIKKFRRQTLKHYTTRLMTPTQISVPVDIRWLISKTLLYLHRKQELRIFLQTNNDRTGFNVGCSLKATWNHTYSGVRYKMSKLCLNVVKANTVAGWSEAFPQNQKKTDSCCSLTSSRSGELETLSSGVNMFLVLKAALGLRPLKTISF